MPAGLRAPHGPKVRWRPDTATVVGLAVLLAYLLPARLVVPALGAAGRPSLLIGLGLLAWWLLARLTNGVSITGKQPARIAAGFFVMSFLVSYGLGFARELRIEEVTGADRSLLRYLGLIGLLLAVSDGIRSRARLDRVLRAVVAGAAFMAAVGALQSFFRLDVTPWIKVPGLGLNADLIGVGQRGAGFARVAGTAGHYIEFGVLMAFALPIALHFAQHAPRRGSRQRYAAVAALIALCAFLSISRSAIVALAVTMLFLLPSWSWRGRCNALVLGVLFLAAVRVTRPGLLGTIWSLFGNLGNDPSFAARTEDYAVVGPLISERPWFGRGPGTYSPVNYVLLDNQWLGTLVTTGAVGVLTLFVLVATGFALAKRVGRWASDEPTRQLGHAIAAPLAGAVVVTFTFDSLSFSGFAVTVFLLVGAAAALWRLAGMPAPPPDSAAEDFASFRDRTPA